MVPTSPDAHECLTKTKTTTYYSSLDNLRLLVRFVSYISTGGWAASTGSLKSFENGMRAVPRSRE
jgi:hypothetical protein